MARKYARIFVRGHYLFREANSFPRAKLEENCELRGTDNVQGQISEHIFAYYWRLLSLLSFKSFSQRAQFSKLGNILGYRYSCSWSVSGLKVNDQLVAYATRFSAVRLKNHVWSHHRALKAKVQCDFSSTYSPDHSNVLRLINMINIRYNITRQKIRKSHHFSFIGVCSIRHL